MEWRNATLPVEDPHSGQVLLPAQTCGTRILFRWILPRAPWVLAGSTRPATRRSKS